MPTTAAENGSTSSLLSLGPKSAPMFPGVCYDGATGDGVLCRFQKFIPVWCFFFWIFKGFNQVFFSSIAPRDTTRWHKHYAKMMGEKERLTWNLMQFVYIFFCIISVSIPQIFQGSMMVSFRFTQFTETSLLFGKQDTLGLWKKDRKNRANFVEFVGRCGRAPWLSWNSLNELFWRDGRLFLGVQTSLIWQNMFVWNDAGRWWILFWWNVGKLLQVNETTSLSLECRAFTVRFSIRDRSSLRQRMTFYLYLFMFKSSWNGNS